MASAPARSAFPPAGDVLRTMAEADLPAVAEAEARIYPFPWTLGNFRDSLLCEDRAWVWEDAAGLVGYAVVNQVLDEAQLLNISLLPERQGRGLGTRLLQFVCDDARAHRASRLFLEVRPSNAAGQALYRRFGFVPVGLRKGYYPAAGGREDAIVMELKL